MLALASTGTRFREAQSGDGLLQGRLGCTIPNPVRVTHGPTGVEYAPPLLIRCQLALDLLRIEGVVQQEAHSTLGHGIRRIETMGSFSCRRRRSGKWSEHARGNAVDIARFIADNGESAIVKSDYATGLAEAISPQGIFLRRVEQRLKKDTALTTVLGPHDNADHWDHFHIDHAVDTRHSPASP